LPCPPPGDLPDTGTKLPSPAALAFQADSILLSHKIIYKFSMKFKKKREEGRKGEKNKLSKEMGE